MDPNWQTWQDVLHGARLPFAIFCGIAGLLIGSFLNVVIYRLPRGESVVHPGSHCPKCQRDIAPWDNIPVISYLILRGRCRNCRATISLRYPLFEATTGLLFGLVAWQHGVSWMTPIWLGFSAALVTAAAIDFDEQIIPDEISVGGLVIGLIVVPLAAWKMGGSWAVALQMSLVGALLGGGLLWVVAFLHARYCAVRGRRFEHWPEGDEPFPEPREADYWLWFPGLGLGDVKLLAMIGAFLGPVGVVYTILLSALTGLVMGAGFALATRDWNAPFGFGPSIAVGALLLVLLPKLATL